jgi:hypothetical protein
MNNIAFWNIRGANSPSKQFEIRNLLKEKDIQLICISETKLDIQSSVKAVAIIAPSWSSDHNFLEAKYGRLLTLWNPSVFNLSRICASDQFIHYQCTHLPSGLNFLLTSVYAHNSLSLRQIFLDHLPSLNPLSFPWLVGGDFNCMFACDQKFGGCSLSLKDISPLNSAICQANLFSLKFFGSVYTWSNCSRNGNVTLCKLDHIFINLPFLQFWPNSFYHIHQPSLSDHCPLIFQNGADKFGGGKHTFKFFNFWTKHVDYFVILRQVWSMQFGKDPLANIILKMKVLKFHLKVWSAEHFGNDSKLSTQIRNDLIKIQEALCIRPCDTLLKQAELHLRNELEKVIDREVSTLKQKLHVKMEKEADRNTKYYHNFLKVKRSRDSIFQVKDMNGLLVNTFDGINQAFVQYFSSVLAPSTSFIPDLNPLFNITLPSLSDTLSCSLISVITEEEIRNAVFSLDSNSCGGPDGFNAYFIQHSWSIIGSDIVIAIKYFFLHNKLPAGLSATAIALIPKIVNPTSVTDFRPISCCNIIYKIISKILANRLQLVLPSIISINQAAYIKGRSISDNILLTQELLFGYERKTISPRCMLKLDIRKAFDSVHWNSILEVMSKMNFPKPFLAWIYTCISSPMYSILRDGGLYGYFKGIHGVRQGDPISAYLFIIVMELLNSLFKELVINGVLHLHPKCKHPQITHLLFADDLVVFTKPTIDNIQCILSTLKIFHSITGLQINLAKSNILVAGLSPLEMKDIINFSGLQELPRNSFYLGLPLITSRLSKQDCMPLFEKIIEKLHLWPVGKLSQAGRLTIVQSIAVAMTTYWTRHYILPAKLINMITSALNKFLWHGDPFSKKLIPISFNKLFDSKKHGGLGITNICQWNRAAISVYYNKIFTTDNNLWSQWVNHNLIGRKNFWTMSIPQSCSWSWRCILKLRETFIPLIQCNHDLIKDLSFWHSPWSKQGLILSSIVDYNLRNISGIAEQAKVVDFIHDGSLVLPYTSSFQLRQLWNIISSYPTMSSDNVLVWSGKTFSINLVYKSLCDNGFLFPWYTRIWKIGGSAKENLLLWKVMANALNTKDKLCRIGIISDNMCVFCKSETECNTHLFFECSFVFQIWYRLLLSYGFYKPSAVSSIEWFNIFKATRWKSCQTRLLLKMLKRLVYEVWQERNNRIFGSSIRSSSQLFDQIHRNILWFLRSDSC